MDNSGGISPVGAVPTVTPVGQRRPRPQQMEEKKPHPAEEPVESEERGRDNDAEGLDCYA